MIIMAPINGFTIQKLDKNTMTYGNGKSTIIVSIASEGVISDSKMKKDLNKIEKILVKVDGKRVNIITKVKGWDRYKYYPSSIIDKTTTVKGNIEGKNVSIYTYNKKNKLIKSTTNQIKTVSYVPRLTKSNASKLANLEAKKAYKNSKYDVYVSYNKLVYFRGNLYWSFDVSDKKTGIIKGGGFALDDKTGKATIE